MQAREIDFPLLFSMSTGDPSTGCMIWLGHLASNGYSSITSGRGNREYVHRLTAWVPPGKQVHHTCHNKACIEPAHLEIVTPSEHSVLHGTKEFCLRGHDLSVYRYGRSQCRVCKSIRGRKSYLRHRAKRIAYSVRYKQERRRQRR